MFVGLSLEEMLKKKKKKKKKRILKQEDLFTYLEAQYFKQTKSIVKVYAF